MDKAIIRECTIFGYSILTGSGIVAGYDVLRLLRYLIPHPKWAVDGEDVLFWICCYPILFELLYNKNTENMRCYEILGASLGIIFYEKCIHKNLLKLLTFLEKKVKLIIESFLRN